MTSFDIMMASGLFQKFDNQGVLKCRDNNCASTTYSNLPEIESLMCTICGTTQAMPKGSAYAVQVICAQLQGKGGDNKGGGKDNGDGGKGKDKGKVKDKVKDEVGSTGS